MITAFVSLGIFLAGQALAGIVWGIRLEGKVNLQDQKVTDLKELITVRFDAADVRLGRIERALNGALGR